MDEQDKHRSTVRALSAAILLILIFNTGLALYTLQLRKEIDSSSVRVTSHIAEHRHAQEMNRIYVEENRRFIRNTRRLLKQVQLHATITRCIANETMTSHLFPIIDNDDQHRLHDIDTPINETSSIIWDLRTCPPNNYGHIERRYW